MSDRITPYNTGSISERIDEIVISNPESVHFEMMRNGEAWMRIGDIDFWFEAKKGGQLICRYRSGPVPGTAPRAMLDVGRK